MPRTPSESLKPLLDEAVTTVVKGAERLNRKWPELIITGFTPVAGVTYSLQFA